MRKRYYVLDALRGVAAICVLFYHGMFRFGQRETWEFLQNAYLAVDFFFALSGFVIASSYQEKITSGSLSFGRFFVIRCIRFYPMIFASVAIAGPLYLYDLHCAQKISGTAFLDIIATALCLPTLYFVLAFPLNIPLWSLFCELCVNFAFVLAVPFFGRKEFVYTLGVSFMALLVLAYPDGISDLGWKSETITGGMVRALFSFLIGVAVYHVHQTIRLPETKAILLAPCVALAFMLVPNWNVFTGAYLYNFLCITAAFPALILVAANIKLGAAGKWLSERLGDLSYPLYAIHIPVFAVLARVEHKLGLGLPLWLESIAIIALSLFLAYYWDAPVRWLLKSTLLAQRAKVAVPA